MKTKYYLVVAIVSVFLMIAAVGTSVAADVIKWKMQTLHPHKAVGGKIAFAWAAAMKEMTNGKLEVEIFPPGAFCKPTEVVQSLQLGVFDCATTYGAFHAGTIPEANLEVGLPLAHQNWIEAWDAFYNRGLADLISEAYSEKKLAWYPVAADNPYHFVTREPVTKLSDLKGKKIRAVGAWGKYAAALGATVTTVMPAEMYMALKLGTIDGAIYGSSGLKDSKIDEVVNYYTLPTAGQIAGALMISQKSIEKLPKEIRKVVEVGSRYVMSDMSSLYVAHCKNSVAQSVKEGQIKLTVLPEEELAKMRKLVLPIWDEIAAKSPRCKKGVEILKKQMIDLGRPME